jgi:hypothetical protein
MGAFPQSLPSMPGSPSQPTPGNVSTLLGNQPAQPAPGPTPEQRVQAYMDQVRALHMQIDALALDHPEASEDLNTAKNALTNSMSKVASAMTQPEQQPQPPTF